MSGVDQKLLTKNILSAAEQGFKKALQDYISRKLVNVVDEEGSTPLMYAAANGREEIVRILLDKECIASNKLEHNTDTKYIDQQNVYGWTALMQAACYGHLNVVISLVQRGVDVNVKNSWGASALVGASQGGYFGVVHKLLNVGAKVNPEEDPDGARTLTPLMAATQCGHAEIVQELLRRGANVETRLKSTKWTALMLAALNNQLQVVELLLKNGADKSVKDVNEQTAADLANALGNEEMAFLLTGKKPKKCSELEFFELVKAGEMDKIHKVLEAQKQLVNSRDKDGATPLMLAANRGNVKMCEVLLDEGANVNTTDEKYGWTALMLATHSKKYEVVKMLGKRGADVNVRGKSGSTAFDVANMISDIKMIRLVANISVEQIQRKASLSSDDQDVVIPALSGRHKSLKDHMKPQPSSDTSPNVGVAKGKEAETNGDKKAGPVVPDTIDLTELKRKLDKAYRTPTPNISVDNEEPLSKGSPTQARFPMKPPSSPRKLATPTPLSSLSSSASELSSSTSSTPSAGPGRLAPFGPGSDPFSDRSNPASPGSSTASLPSRKKPLIPSLASKSGQSPTHRASPTSHRSSSVSSAQRKISNPSLFQPKLSPGVKTTASNSFVKSKSSSFPKVGEPVRKRSSTAPAKGIAKPKKKISVPKKPEGSDKIKSVLESDALGHLYPIFEAQEIDWFAFLSLSVSHLKELGVKGDDLHKLHTLITKLKLTSPALTPSTAGAASPRKFTFIDHDLTH